MSPDATLSDVGVVIVNYRTAPEVERCLTVLWADVVRGLRVVIVDNDSGDGSADRIESWLTQQTGGGDRVVVVRSGANVGFGAGNNSGVAWFDDHQPPAYLWFLNPDCEVEPRAAEVLLRSAEGDPSAIWGALLVERDAPEIVQCAGGYRYWPCLTRMQPLLAGRQRGELAGLDAPKHLDYIAGASMFCSRALFTKAGGFSPELFLYFEEADLCDRIQADGGRLAVALDAVVRHEGGASTEGKSSGRRRSSAVSEYHATLSALLFTWRRHRRCFPVAAAVRLPFKAAQLVRFGQPGLIASVLAAYWAFARRAWVRR